MFVSRRVGGLLWFVLFQLTSMVFAYDYNYCAAPSQLSVTNTNYTLEFVQVITRHGDRTTVNQLPGDSYVWQCTNLTTFMAPSTNQAPSVNVSRLYRKNYLPGREPTPGNCYLGELTARGFQQHLELGQNLRQLYVNTYNFLPENINASIMAIRSTDVPRTLASAQGNSLGLYPAQSTNSDSVPVIDIFTMDTTYENMFPNTQLCPRAGQLLNQISAEPAYVAWTKSQLPLLEKIAGIIGVTVQELPDWPGLFDAFQVMTCYNQTYPGMDQETIDQIFANANWQWNYQLNNTELAYLQLGEFATELVTNIQDYINGEDMPQYMVFSGHDTTVGPLLATLQAYDGQWPPYASHMQMELWSNGGQYFVQVKYQGEPLLLSTCSATMCPFSQFMDLVNPIVSVDYSQACQLTNSTK